VPENLYSGADRVFFIDLMLTDSAGKIVSRNFYWVPGTLTTFDWLKTDYTHTPAARQEDMSGLASLPAATVTAQATQKKTANGRELRVELKNTSPTLAFQVNAAVRTPGGELIAPVFWSDNWIELVPGETRVLTALLPESGADAPTVRIEGWNVAAQTLTPAP